MPAPGVPDGYNSVIPYLIVEDGNRTMDFLVKGLGGSEVERITGPDGVFMHGEVRIGDSMVMMGQARDGCPAMPCMLYLYVADCDALYGQALAAGAESVQEPADQFYGDRTAGVKDADGIQYFLGTRKKTLSPEELAKKVQG